MSQQWAHDVPSEQGYYWYKDPAGDWWPVQLVHGQSGWYVKFIGFHTVKPISQLTPGTRWGVERLEHPTDGDGEDNS